MSERNVELMRRFNEAVNARDIETVIAYSDPTVELHPVFAAVDGAVYHGHGGARKYFEDIAEAW